MSMSLLCDPGIITGFIVNKFLNEMIAKLNYKFRKRETTLETAQDSLKKKKVINTVFAICKAGSIKLRISSL